MKIYILLSFFLFQSGCYSQFSFKGKNLFEHTKKCSMGFIDENQLIGFKKEQIFYTNLNDTFLNFEIYNFDTMFLISIQYSDSNKIESISIKNDTCSWCPITKLNDSTLGLRHLFIKNKAFSFDLFIITDLQSEHLNHLFRKKERLINFELNKTIVFTKRVKVYLSNILIY